MENLNNNTQRDSNNPNNQPNETASKPSGKLKNIVDWITEESTKLGYNWNTLPRNKQNQIISSIMSGLENGFRSRCNYPDLRFAKRRGIGKQFTNINNNITNNQQFSPASIDQQCPDPPPDACGVLPGDVCDSNGCGGGGVGDTDCQEYDGKTCDNGCVNETAGECSDGAQECVDCDCINNADCGDSGAGCVDNSCENNAACNDSGIACIDNQCGNTSSCNDKGDCKDNFCSNSEFSGGCTDTSTNSKTCVDIVCINESSCGDNGFSTSLRCTDTFCFNQPTGLCKDEKCIDAPCNNNSTAKENGCIDTTCWDNACIDNRGKLQCIDAPANQCNDDGCVNAPQGCQNTGCDSGLACIDSGPQCGSDPGDSGTGESEFCLDINDCIDSSDCENSYANCIDRECADQGCTNTGGQCRDEEQCSDFNCTNEYGQCSDINCSNTGGCVDEGCPPPE